MTGFWSSMFEGVQERELRETHEAWDNAEQLLRASPIGSVGVGGLALSLLADLYQLAGRLPEPPVFEALYDATANLLDLEEIGRIDPLWSLIKADMSAAVDFRQMTARRTRWAREFDDRHRLVRRYLLPLWRHLLEELPEHCFQRPGEGESTLFEVPLIDFVDRPAEFIERLAVFPYAEELSRAGIFQKLRERLGRNVLIASGLPAASNLGQVRSRLVLPTGQRGASASTLAERYLAGTPFAALTDIPVPFAITHATRFEHTHILGGTGHGKTQLMQRMIHADLVAAKEDGRSVVVIDSQGDLINKLVRLELFDPDVPGSLADRLVLIDPADIEFPASLNLFDAHLDRLGEYRAVDRERVLNGVVELYETFFGDMLGAELTQKQGVVFRYLARLMLTIPGATIHTLMQLMEDGKPFKPHMDRLEGSARYFFETEFFHPSFAATKKQILRRLWGVLSTPAFERMFAQSRNKLDLFEATRAGSIILINTAKDLLKQDGSALFGRLFINMLAQAALERSVLPEDERTPTFVYVDEAQEYFGDASVETILQQARKYRIGLIAAHQTLDQASPRLRSALFANTSFKCVGGVSAKDARVLAEELRTTPDFIESMRRRGDRTEFAAWIKHQTGSAIRLTVPLGHVERQPVLSEEAYDALLAMNRARYCGTLAETLRYRAETPNPATEIVPEEMPPPAAEPLRTPAASPVREAAPPVPPRPARPPVAERELGKGGKKHRYLQALVKGLAEEQGFKATIEAPMPGGQVDVLLEREGMAVAVEVSVTTPVDWERENLRTCLAAGFSRIALVLAKSQTTAKRYREAVVEGFSGEERARISILYADDLPDFIAALAPAPEPSENIVKGYRVRVSSSVPSPLDAKARRETIARLVAQSLGRQNEPQ